MDTRTIETRTAYAAAIAKILRDQYEALGMTRKELEDASGIKKDTFRWYFEEVSPRPIPVGNYFSLVTALRLDPGKVADQAAAIVSAQR